MQNNKCIECKKNDRAKGRKVCFSCKQKRYKENNPLPLAYNTLKQNAKRRKKSFSLTFLQFKEFCFETDYMVKKGTKSKSYHIDRIIELEGYHKDNIQTLENCKNSEKYRNFKKSLQYQYNENTGNMEFWVITEEDQKNDFSNVPF
jgi:hypothetical protein